MILGWPEAENFSIAVSFEGCYIIQECLSTTYRSLDTINVQQELRWKFTFSTFQKVRNGILLNATLPIGVHNLSNHTWKENFDI